LQYISNLDFTCFNCDVQSSFDAFYELAKNLLEQFYPERTITVSSRDPDFVTPTIKAKLRRKNRLMHKGNIENANALSA